MFRPRFHHTLYVPVQGVSSPEDDKAGCATTTKCEFVCENGNEGTVTVRRSGEGRASAGEKRKRNKLGGALTYAELNAIIAELWQINATFHSENERLKSLNAALRDEMAQTREEYDGEVSRLNKFLADIIDAKF